MHLMITRTEIRLYIMRHGETNSNQCKASPLLDEGLNSIGRKQVIAALNKTTIISPIDGVFSSELKRALETSELVLKKYNTQCISNPLFNERIFNPIESYKTFTQRVFNAIEYIVSYNNTRKKINTYLLCTHAVFIKQFLLLCSESKLNRDAFDIFNAMYGVKNAQVIELSFCNGSWVVPSFDDTFFCKDV